jgi:hypothetical protein
MTISTYSELKDAVADEVKADDISDKLARFVLMGESKLNASLRLLDMVTTETGTLDTSTRTLALPTLYLDKIRFQIDSPLKELTWVPPARLLKYVSETTTSGEPDFYTVTSAFAFERIPDSAYAYTLLYYKGYRLAEADDTNYLLTNFPQAYLYAACMYASLHLRDFEHARVMSDLMQAEVKTIKRLESRKKGEHEALLVTELSTSQPYDVDHD